MAETVNVGRGNILVKSRIVGVLLPTSDPIKRMIRAAREEGMLFDCTHGKTTRSVVILDTKMLVLSNLNPETLIARMEGKEGKERGDESGK